MGDGTGDRSGSQYVSSATGEITEKERARFEAFRDATGAGCWRWAGSLSSGGYGKFGLRYQTRSAHRVAYEIENGPIPPGLFIHHVCGVRLCVRPSHLQAVTPRENNLASDRVLSAINARKTRCPQGHPYAGDNLYITPQGARHCRACKRVNQARYMERRRDAGRAQV